MLNAGAGGHAPQIGIVTSGVHVAGSLWQSCGEGGPCRWWHFGTKRGQLLHNTALVMRCGKNRQLVDQSGVQATGDCP